MMNNRYVLMLKLSRDPSVCFHFQYDTSNS